MADNVLVSSINEWLADQALSEPDIVGMFEGLCNRLYGIGIPVSRARLTWPTLHPLFQAETILWNRGGETEFEQFVHQETMSDAWLQSPMKHMMEHDISVIRRRLDGPDKLLDFPILEDMLEKGFTDYLVVTTDFAGEVKGANPRRRGIILTWCADRPGGFTNGEIESLQKIQRRFAVACKTVIQARISNNIVETYLGKQAGERVMSGKIRRGDGSKTNAIVWYSDLRNSTAMADTMPGDEYLDLLNCYFECTAGPVIDAGGEVLDFIGDGVLAIFPFDDGDEKDSAIGAATTALKVSIVAQEKMNETRKKAGLMSFKFGIGLNVGSLMFGNIGVPQRLTFSVIGPTVNEVARIESLTKIIGENILVTREIAALDHSDWVSLGEHTLSGVSQKVELFTFAADEKHDSTRVLGSINQILPREKATRIN
jgi:adenylate cyclase